MTEQQVINNAFYLFEKDATPWTPTSDEYLTARGLANIAIGRWEFLDNTKWRDLWTTLTDSDNSLGGVKTTTSGIYSYACPSDMRYPASYVRIAGELFSVIPVEETPKYVDSKDKLCWFSGSIKDGFKLKVNPNLSLTTGDLIEYEYYKQATLFTAVSSVTEMQDPYFISYFIASHIGDDGVIPDFYQMAEARLDQMKTANMSNTWGSPNSVGTPLEDEFGFGL